MPLIDDAELLRRNRSGLVAEVEFFGAASTTGRVFRAPGLVASIVSATPDRSLFNGVVANDAASLRASYDRVKAEYAAANVRAFTVWLDPGDDASADFLRERGHKIDSKPVAMAALIDDVKIESGIELDWEPTTDIGTLARINDAAYGFPPPAFAAAFARFPEGDAWRGFVARIEGRPVSCLFTYLGPDGDCGIMGVASLPEARGRGIAGGLLARALADARARGATSTSLQASPMGKSVYARLGYRDLGAMGMWEHRLPAA